MNQEELMYYIQEEVDRQWQLPNRPDLKEDCVNYIGKSLKETEIGVKMICT